jgi:hypothetical protein
MAAWVGTTFPPFPKAPPNNFNKLYNKKAPLGLATVENESEGYSFYNDSITSQIYLSKIFLTFSGGFRRGGEGTAPTTL